MISEHISKAIDAIDLAKSDLKQALEEADAVQSIILLQYIEEITSLNKHLDHFFVCIEDVNSTH